MSPLLSLLLSFRLFGCILGLHHDVCSWVLCFCNSFIISIVSLYVYCDVYRTFFTLVVVHCILGRNFYGLEKIDPSARPASNAHGIRNQEHTVQDRWRRVSQRAFDSHYCHRRKSTIASSCDVSCNTCLCYYDIELPSRDPSSYTRAYARPLQCLVF